MNFKGVDSLVRNSDGIKPQLIVEAKTRKEFNRRLKNNGLIEIVRFLFHEPL